MLIDLLGFSDWIETKKSGEFKSIELDDLDCCEKCEQPCEVLYRIECQHLLCEECVNNVAGTDDDDIAAGVCPLF